jgi:sugar lactone lactonase YvrE|tara:strand:- start:259 stop:1131 length:873 start_codon:yes stop_codon:yes gene_type:complete
VRKFINLFIFIFIFIVFSHHSQVEAFEKVWEAKGFHNPESAVYDSNESVLYISVMDGGGLEKNGKGKIAKMSTDGKIIDLAWFKGMNAPKGLDIFQGNLYAADIDKLYKINLKTKAVKSFPIPNAKFLNDVTVDSSGNVYASDMMDNAIYRITRQGKVSVWLKDDKLEGPNGLLALHDTLYVAGWGVMKPGGFATTKMGNIKKIDIQNKTISQFGSFVPIGNLDGIEADGKGGFFVTDWMHGKLMQIESNGVIEGHTFLGKGSADLEYIDTKRLLIVPMMKDGVVRAFRH